jgi:hypothetical protein
MKRIRLFKCIKRFFAVAALLVTMNSCGPKGKYIGLQLYSLRDSIKNDVLGTIAKVSEIGYKFVEPAGYRDGKFYGMEPAEFKKLCDEHNLPILSFTYRQECS